MRPEHQRDYEVGFGKPPLHSRFRASPAILAAAYLVPRT